MRDIQNESSSSDGIVFLTSLDVFRSYSEVIVAAEGCHGVGLIVPPASEFPEGLYQSN